MSYAAIIAKEFSVKEEYVANIIALLDEGNTIPFIARYRKEMHGTMDDQTIRLISDKLEYLRNLDARREEVRSLIEGQGNLTEEIAEALQKAVTLAEIDDSVHLIAPTVIEPIQHLKVDHLGNRNPRLHTDEVLIALSISAATDPVAEKAMEQLSKLRGCECHSSVILSPVDEKIFKRLGMNLTCQPRYKG